MKRSRLVFGILQVTLDGVAALAALLLAYTLRQQSIDLIPSFQFISLLPALPTLNTYVQTYALPWGAVFIALLAFFGLYTLHIQESPWRQMGRIFFVAFFWFALILAWYALIEKKLFFSRILLVQSTFFLALLTIVSHMCITILERIAYRYGIGKEMIVVLGSEESYHFLGAQMRHPAYSLHSCTSLDELKKYAHHHPIDRLIDRQENSTEEDREALIAYCRNAHIQYMFFPAIVEKLPHLFSFELMGAVRVLSLQMTSLDGWGRVWKRIIDIILSAILIILLAPILLMISIIILLSMGFPMMYISHRVGVGGRGTIPVLKFRTMKRNADQEKEKILALNHRTDGPLFKMKNDPRITPLGKLLRRYSLDELPQLFNVLLGHLSLVGPRPHLPDEVAKYRPHHHRVFLVKPGITGLAQVSGRSDLPFEQEIAYDMQYIERWSIGLDLWILWRTIFVVLFGKGAD
jgi:exopolysaccharide biosynthesis polyprenyl glycosylphosphotransferase